MKRERAENPVNIADAYGGPPLHREGRTIPNDARLRRLASVVRPSLQCDLGVCTIRWKVRCEQCYGTFCKGHTIYCRLCGVVCYGYQTEDCPQHAVYIDDYGPPRPK